MKDKVKGLIVGLTIGSLLSGSAVFAAGTQIEVAFRNLKFMFDGVEKTPQEGKGFIYEGSTYVPLRFVSESLGKEVQWDEASNTIWIGKAPHTVVATFKGGQVTQQQFDTFLAVNTFFQPSYGSQQTNQQYLEEMVKQLVSGLILNSRVSEQDRAADKARAVKQVTDWNNQYGEQFTSSMSANKITQQDVIDFLASSYSAQRALGATLTDERLKEQYDTHLKSNPNYYTSASVRHILIGLTDSSGKALRTKEEALARAEDVESKLMWGGDFAKLAAEYSDDPGSKDNGGLYETTPVTQWVEPFGEAAATQKIGEVGKPVETMYGYHIIKVESRAVRTFEEVKPELQNELMAEVTQKFTSEELPGLIESIHVQP
ncbi:peptidylprolyl isomerase [Paenibacillus athensensis]|uniref:PpiC domain-containing protein n=1 Tax=Paenibacillus athensensis TaxID=1967502 RepID=A0A4Y8Q843_9BACL|nr:peptidylprolyl isomerase [Paenibacillus athensensis]MCD1260312.1 peptidylprolyl isomerase [Paenibacillus athensensis]